MFRNSVTRLLLLPQLVYSHIIIIIVIIIIIIIINLWGGRYGAGVGGGGGESGAEGGCMLVFFSFSALLFEFSFVPLNFIFSTNLIQVDSLSLFLPYSGR